MKFSSLEKVNLSVVSNHCYYSQTPQTTELQWAILNRLSPTSFRELHLKVKCREYFGDLVVGAQLQKQFSEIYGLALKNNDLMAIDETLFSISLSGDRVKFLLQKIKILNDLEKSMGISTTKIYRTSDRLDVVGLNNLVLVGDKKWVSAPLLISIYSLIIRTLVYNTGAKSLKAHFRAMTDDSRFAGNDEQMVNNIESYINIRHLLKNIDAVIEGNPLTGVNDASLKHQLSMTSGKIDYSTEYRLASNLASPPFTYWSLYRNHSQHGISSLVAAMKYYKSVGRFDSMRAVGITWAANYLDILEKKGK